MDAPKIYCTARSEFHACEHEWNYEAHPGDGTDHTCHCGETWVDHRFQRSQKPQLAHVVQSGSWSFSVGLGSCIELGPVFSLWFGHRGLHLPLRWRSWRR